MVLSANEEIPFDYLVLAAGSTTNYFGLRALEERALGLKDLPEALELRNRILTSLEAAAATTDEQERQRLLTFAVIGGGPTGVEYAGALSELLDMLIPEEYPELTRSQARVVLIEALPHVLAPFDASLRKKAQEELERKNVEVWTETRVLDWTGDVLTLSPEKELVAATVVWAAGVRPSPLASTTALAKSKSGRIEVDPYLRVSNSERIFAIGDIASFAQDGKEVPMLSAPAMQEGRHVAETILRMERNEGLRPFKYRDRGTMATIGRNSAVAQFSRLRLNGFLGWLAWLSVHLYFLIGFRNRLAVFGGWAWNYLRKERPVRIITRAQEHPSDDKTPTGSPGDVSVDT